MRLACLASNSGSSFRAIVGAIEAGTLAATPVLLVSNKPSAPALDFARSHDVPAAHIPTKTDPAGADLKLLQALEAAGPDLVVLSGYLRKLGPRVLARYAGRVLNIHPALLPQFGGQGMYGRRVHDAVIASGAPVSGATVHVVDEEYDHGPIVAQVEVPVLPGDDAASLEARVMAAEPALFVQTLQRISTGAIELPVG